jgi:hypothetical protein
VPPGQRVACPRCGDTFPFRLVDADDAADSPAAAVEPPTFAPQPAPPVRRPLPNWAIAVAILAGMGVMAAACLVYALSTVATRRDQDWHSTKRETLSVPLAARLGLGVYLLALVGTVVWERKRRRWLVAAGEQPQTVLGRWAAPVLGSVVLVGVGLVLLSIPMRSNRHLPAPAGGSGVPVQAVPPAQLAALNYLPEDTNLVAGFHVAEALRDSAARELLAPSSERIGKTIRDRFREWTSLELEVLDHAVLGVKLDEQLIPRVLLVVRTQQPYDIQHLVQALKAVRLTQAGGRTVYRYELENPLRQNGYLACPDERTMLIALKAEDLKRAPPFPRPVLGRLPAPLQAFFQERLHPPTPFWAVGHVDDWEKTALHSFVRLGIKDDWAILSKVRTFGLWWQPEDVGTLKAAFRCVDEDSARALRLHLLAEENGEYKVLRGLELRADAQGMAGDLAGTLKAEQKDAWLTLRIKTGSIGRQ